MANKSPGVFLPRQILSFLTVLASFTLFSPSAVPAQDQPTVISNVKVEPSPFSPNGDGINETTKFSFTLSEGSRVTVEIMFFGSDVTIGGVNLFYGILTDTLRLGDQKILFASDTIYQNNNAPAGLNEFIWNGTIRYNLIKSKIINLPDSIYTYLIRAEDLDTDDQYKGKPVTGKVKIDSRPPVISSYSASPDPFSPNNDGINDAARISFTLSGLPQNASLGTIAFKVIDVGGTRSFVLDQPNTTKAFYGAAAPLTVPYAPIALQFIKRTKNNNAFSFRIRGGRILDSGDTVTVFTKEITVNPTDPVGKVYNDETLFSFIDSSLVITGATDVIENSQVDVMTSTGGGVKVDIFNPVNVKVDSNLVLDPPFIGDGTYSVNFPNKLPYYYEDGTYNYVITAVDESGNLAEVTGTVTARSNPIKVTDLTVVPAVISPADKNNMFDFCILSYSLTQPGYVNIQVFRDSTVFVSNNLVRNLLTYTAQEAKGYTVKWDGKNDAGQYVSQNGERDYRIIVSATDRVTQQTSEARGLITVDNRPPVELVLDPLPARTKSAAAMITGHTESGNTVRLFLNGEELPAPTVDANFGLFTAQVQLNREGLNLINALAFDAVGNGPTKSDTLRVVLDTQAPLVTDTLISISGVSRKLAGAVLLGFGRNDTIELRLSDGVGRVSGINLALSTMSVSSPSGADIEGTVIRKLPDAVLFVPTGQTTQTGTYNLHAIFSDSLENTDSIRVAFSIGEASTGPTLVSLNPDPATDPFRNSSKSQNWQFTVQVADNSGTGINAQSSSLELYFLPSAAKINGSYSAANDLLTLQITQPIATDGSGDGEYELRITVDDNDPSSGTLHAAFKYLNDTRLPDTLHVAADSARFAVTLADPAPGSGINLIGINSSNMTVDSGGVRLTRAVYSNDGDSTLFASFDPPLRGIGVYTVNVTIVDRAGNLRVRSAAVAVGSAELRPTVETVSQPFDGVAKNAAALIQPLIVGLQVKDNSGTGIDWASSFLRIFGPDSVEIQGQLSWQQQALILAIGKTLSNSGSDDGLYRLAAHVQDFSPLTGNLDTTFSFILDDLPPDTAGITFAPDTSSVTIRLADLPAVAGRASSGVNILTAQAAVSDPTGAQVAAVLSHDGVSTLSLSFTSGKPTPAGLYTLTVTFSDRAGNQRIRKIVFPLNVTGILTLFPPDSSVVRGNLFRVWAMVTGMSETFTPGTAAVIRVNRRGVPVAGLSQTKGDTVIFAFSDTLRTDGSADGKYEVIAELDIQALGTRSTRRAFFTLDNVPPDTSRIEVTVSAQGVRAVAELTDHGLYPDVGGIDQKATTVKIEDPAGRVVEPDKVVWLDDNTLEAQFKSLATAGLHRLRFDIQDRAGLVTIRRVALINTFGLAQGTSVSFVEEVPARTRARINFVSGHTDKKITRAVLRIFNLRGDLIRRLDVTERIDASGSAVSAEWLLDNDGGSLVMNGVFIYGWEVTFSDGWTEKIKKTLAVARK